MIDCGTLLAPSGGTVDVSGTRLNSYALYSCNTSYGLAGVHFRQCQRDGTWSNTAPHCQSKN